MISNLRPITPIDEFEEACIKANLNNNVPGRTKAQYNQDNKEKIAEKGKEYRVNNKEEISEKKKQYEANNKERIAEKKKEYYENNKEKIAEKGIEYRVNNKEKIAVRVLEKITCNHCGVLISRCNLERHKRTPKCINYVPPVIPNDIA